MNQNLTLKRGRGSNPGTQKIAMQTKLHGYISYSKVKIPSKEVIIQEPKPITHTTIYKGHYFFYHYLN